MLRPANEQRALGTQFGIRLNDATLLLEKLQLDAVFLPFRFGLHADHEGRTGHLPALLLVRYHFLGRRAKDLELLILENLRQPLRVRREVRGWFRWFCTGYRVARQDQRTPDLLVGLG